MSVSPLVSFGRRSQMYNYFEDAHYVYLVLELCDNGELCRYLRTSGRKLSEEEVRRLFRQTVQGLIYLHSHNILHRDLTLANLLLTNTLDAVSGHLFVLTVSMLCCSVTGGLLLCRKFQILD